MLLVAHYFLGSDNLWLDYFCDHSMVTRLQNYNISALCKFLRSLWGLKSMFSCVGELSDTLSKEDIIFSSHDTRFERGCVRLLWTMPILLLEQQNFKCTIYSNVMIDLLLCIRQYI
jgi:hypothetical protein